MVVRVGGEDAGLFGWDGGITGDQSSHNTSGGLNSEGKRGNIKKQKALNLLRGVSTEDSSLDSGTVGNGFIRVDGLVQFLVVEEVAQELLDLGDTGGTSNKNDILDLE